ncbi:haloacid dehalogenase type II [Arthrobacter sp. UYEF20]|uniref:haloacid dehalogenase type II n=1 Tax=Arthrobacter sp. UYEF20 TaxID=1756363 RepID=UPI003392272E
MTTPPSVIVFDVNETLSDMSPMGARFSDVGAPAPLATLWFASLLRDGFALTAAGDNGRFAEIGAEVLRGVLGRLALDRGLDQAVEHIMAGMAELGLHPDVPEGVRALKNAGYRLATLTNGSTAVAEALFTPARILDEFDLLLSVEDASGWKPARAAYEYAAAACGVAPEQMMLVAVHPWDIHGAARAGLATAWINRSGSAYPGYFAGPDHTAESIGGLAVVLARAARP